MTNLSELAVTIINLIDKFENIDEFIKVLKEPVPKEHEEGQKIMLEIFNEFIAEDEKKRSII